MKIEDIPFFQGSDYYNPDKLKKWAEALLQDDCFPVPLPDDAYVFVMHQGYEFYFVKLSEGGNPPVYYYLEGQYERDFVKVTDTFEEFILQCSQITKTGG